MRGSLIVFEGIDRSGKSTQALDLVKNLNSFGQKAELLRFPDRTTTIGQLLDAYLKKAKDLDDRALHLLFSANRWELRDSILTKLQAGTTLVVDRYAYSGVAFSAAKGLDLDWCKGPDRGLPAPDLVIYLKLSVEEAATRGGYGDERYEKIDFQRKVLSLYETKLRDSLWKMIDAKQTKEELHTVILQLANTTIEDVKNKPILPLWTH